MVLQLSYFTLWGDTFTQCRGSSIGARPSPGICATVVAHREHIWIMSYNATLHSAGIFIRYVDNRNIGLFQRFEGLPAYRELLDLLFYRYPIELEPCGDSVLLGFEIDYNARTCLYRCPQFQHQYRSPHSAGTLRRQLSGFVARLHILFRGTFPAHRRVPLALSLCEGYISKGFTMRELWPSVRRVQQRYWCINKRSGLTVHK